MNQSLEINKSSLCVCVCLFERERYLCLSVLPGYNFLIHRWAIFFISHHSASEVHVYSMHTHRRTDSHIGNYRDLRVNALQMQILLGLGHGYFSTVAAAWGWENPTDGLAAVQKPCINARLTAPPGLATGWMQKGVIFFCSTIELGVSFGKGAMREKNSIVLLINQTFKVLWA